MMGDAEGGIKGLVPGQGPDPTLRSRIPMSLEPSKAYLCSCAGFLRLINIALGIIALGLWLPGYPNQFQGEVTHPVTGDTDKGYGNGWVREPINQFVLAAIIIALLFSIVLFFGLTCVQSASVDWNRFNKMAHLFLCVFIFITAVCSIYGAWYFNENCCHVTMTWEGTGLAYFLGPREFNYVNHCYCYRTRYSASGQVGQELRKQTTLWVATQNAQENDVEGTTSTFSAHDQDVHLAAIFILFLNSIVYFFGFLFSKSK